jgi:hypothetical protein
MFSSQMGVIEYERRPDFHTKRMCCTFYDERQCAKMSVGRTVIFFGSHFSIIANLIFVIGEFLQIVLIVLQFTFLLLSN